MIQDWESLQEELEVRAIRAAHSACRSGAAMSWCTHRPKCRRCESNRHASLLARPQPRTEPRTWLLRATSFSRCVGLQARAIAEIRGLSRKNHQVGEELVAELLQMHPGPDFGGGDCTLNGHFYIDGDCWRGQHLNVWGYAVLLDGQRRWWISALVSLGGAKVAVIRRYGREGDDAAENIVDPLYGAEWQKIVRYAPHRWGQEKWGDKHGDPLRRPGAFGVLEMDRTYSEVLPIRESHRPLKVEDIDDEWQGLTPWHACWLHDLNLTRFAGAFI